MPAAGRRSTLWLWSLVVAAFFSQTALNLVRPVTTYRLLELGADAAVIGLVTAAYAVLPVVAALWLGRLTDRVPGLRLLVGGGAVMLGLGAAGLALSPGIAAVAVASAVLGMGHLVFTIAGQAAIGRFSPNGSLDAGFGWFTAAYAGGQIVGPLIAGALLGTQGAAGRSAGITSSFWLGAVLSLLVLPAIVLIGRSSWAGLSPRRRPGSTTPGPASSAPAAGGGGAAREGAAADGGAAVPRPTMSGILHVPGVPGQMFASLALLAMLDILTAFLPLVGEEHGISPAWVGVLLAARGIGTILSRGFLPYLSRRFARRTLLRASLLGAGTGLAVPPLLLDVPWLSLLLLFAGGVFLGLGQPLTMSLISEAVPHGWRGTALAVRLMGNRVGQVAMPLLAGAAAAPLGPAGAIWFSCAVLLVSGVQQSATGRRDGRG
ncbi:MFS transporter [Zafaria sp. Z1313]|uniref:MFS transporter n=1 Tax=Zafaria sp. Z1313 TaxID=3423202 RepID=UPI003D30360D